MTIAELYNDLVQLGIPEDRYYLHGLYGSTSDDEKLALIVKMIRDTVEYKVYYKEKGEKHSVRVFLTEDDACQYMYKKLKASKEMEDKYSH
jgi:hypothetical protein